MEVIYKYLRIFCLMSSMIFVASCASNKAKDEPDHRVYKSEYGYIWNPYRYLINLDNGSEIRVCGEQYDSLRWAIDLWSVAIDRTYNLIQSCVDPHILSMSFDQSKEECAKWNLSRPFVLARKKLFLYNCRKNLISKEEILHEVGHLMGLCDQYPGELSRCARTTYPVKKSVMATASFLTLQPDDIEGIQNLEKYIKNKDEGVYIQRENLAEIDQSIQTKLSFCSDAKSKQTCLYHGCLWSQGHKCLSFWMSSCRKSTSKEICLQILGCNWKSESCQFFPY